MESKKNLTAISLFCGQRNWPALLRAIQIFNKTIYKKQSYCIEFNYLSGENIRFSFLINEKEAENLLKLTDEYFKLFFRSAKSVMNKPEWEIFKRFDQNTICYGLYAPIAIGRNEKDNYDIQFTLSKIIIAALNDEDHLDDETILTLAYYFIMTVIKIAIENFSVRKKIIQDFFEAQWYRSKLFEKKVIKAKFNENKSILFEIFDSIGKEYAPRWIKRWEEFVLEYFCKKNDEELVSKLLLLFEQIKKQLGLNITAETLLSYFIFCALSGKNCILAPKYLEKDTSN